MVNRMFSVVVVGVLMIGTAQSCFARLGETEAELEARYGKPERVTNKPADAAPADKEIVYFKDGMVVFVRVFRGRSVCEIYCFSDGKGKSVPVETDIKKAEALLQANAGGAVWEANAPGVHGMQLLWKRSDGQALAAVWETSPNSLQVMDAAYVAESANSDKQKEAGVSGF